MQMQIGKANYKQIRKIYSVAKELGIDNELLHTMTLNTTGVKSIALLTNIQAITLIDELEYKKTGIKKKTVYRSNRATDDQIYKIKALESNLGWEDNPKRLKGFMKKYSRVDEIKWLTFEAASKLIEALKKVQERERKKTLSN